MAIPRAAGGRRVTSRPPISTRPASGCSSPATSRRQVVLPQPLGPSSTQNVPAATVMLTSDTARLAPNCRRTPSSRTEAPRFGRAAAAVGSGAIWVGCVTSNIVSRF